MNLNVGARIKHALQAANLSERHLAAETGLSQQVLCQITNGNREAKLPELILIANATGVTLKHLAGESLPEQRAEYAVRTTDGSETNELQEALNIFLNLNDYLHDQAIA